MIRADRPPVPDNGRPPSTITPEITAWKERQYSKDLWGDGFVGGGANGLFHRFCAEAAASDVGKVEAARKIRLHLAELIRRYHSKVVPGLARGSVAATPWVR